MISFLITSINLFFINKNILHIIIFIKILKIVIFIIYDVDYNVNVFKRLLHFKLIKDNNYNRCYLFNITLRFYI